jgi:hypothetical protein
VGGINIDSGPPCDNTCSNDLKNIIDCKGNVVTPCPPEQGCANAACMNDPCKAAEIAQSSYGCDYFALKTVQSQAPRACFAAFVANTWGKAVHLQVERGGQPLNAQDFTILASNLNAPYTHYDPVAGLAVGEVAILFLSRAATGGGGLPACLVNPAVGTETGVPIDLSGNNGNGLGNAFHITSDFPVVAYQMTPYGGGSAAVTSATLLLPTSAWDTNYIAINAYKSAEPDIPAGNPSLDIVAYKDNTQVTLLPKVAISPGAPGGAIPASAPANMPVVYTLNKGEFLQITQHEELTGSVLQSTEPVGVFGASACMNVPFGQTDCDSGQQQLAPVRALGSEYAAVRYRGRGADVDAGVLPQDEAVPWRLVGAVDGTALTWEPTTPMGAPKSIGLGEMVEFTAPGPFVVKSQGGDHPFYLGGYMTGGEPFGGEGDPDWVNVIPPQQYLNHYVFFTDPTYPETNLVVVRSPSKVDGSFAEVTLNCAGSATPVTLADWQPVGTGYQYARIDISTGNFAGVNGCSNGRQEMQSALPFGVTVWGWGNTTATKQVSYAYPAGAGFTPINQVVIPPIPK